MFVDLGNRCFPLLGAFPLPVPFQTPLSSKQDHISPPLPPKPTVFPISFSPRFHKEPFFHFPSLDFPKPIVPLAAQTRIPSSPFIEPCTLLPWEKSQPPLPNRFFPANSLLLNPHQEFSTQQKSASKLSRTVIKPIWV